MKKDNKYLKTLIFLYFLLFIWSGINPHDYSVWALEIFGVFLGILIYALFNRSIQFSNTTNTWFFIGMSLITIGAHYTFPHVPIFDELSDWAGFERNNYDKLGHIVQGILPVLISREVLVKNNVVKKYNWIELISFCAAIAVSGVYELIEWLFIIILGDNGYTSLVLGAQGYVWDSQSDMLCAMIGALLTILLGRKHLYRLLNNIIV